LTQQEKQVLALTRADGVDPETGLWLAKLYDTRQRMAEVLTGLSDDLLDAVPPNGGSTIGALLYHIAIVEADWLFDEILGTIDTDFPRDLFPVEMREDGNTLTGFGGETLADLLARLKKIRTMLIETVSAMSADQLHEIHERKSYDVTTAWVLHHLMQHEAEHRSQIGAVREALGAPKPGW
jgi:uncharacterized damage-inducible protein DinB